MSQLTLADHLARRVDNFLWLRIIAAIAVIYGHSFALAAPDGSRDVFLRMNWGYYSGDMAVFIFFVVSGFMVSGSYMARNNLADYLVARLLRIVPSLGARTSVSSSAMRAFSTATLAATTSDSAVATFSTSWS